MLITTHLRGKFIKKYQEWNAHLRETKLKNFFEVLISLTAWHRELKNEKKNILKIIAKI